MKECSRIETQTFYFRPDPTIRLGGLWPVRAGWTRADADYRVGPRQIECYSLHFVSDGVLDCEYETRRHQRSRAQLTAGDLFCLFPRRIWAYGATAGHRPPQLLWIAFQGPQSATLLERAGMTAEWPLLRASQSSNVETIFRCLLDLCSSPETDGLLRVIGRLYELMAELSTSSSRGKSHPPINDPDIRQTVAYLERHYHEPLRITTLARKTGLHRSHFTARFSAEVGVPPAEYLRRLRMAKATFLLTKTKLTVTEIAEALGYADLYSFSKAFKKTFGVSPVFYRRYACSTGSVLPDIPPDPPAYK